MEGQKRGEGSEERKNRGREDGQKKEGRDEEEMM